MGMYRRKYMSEFPSSEKRKEDSKEHGSKV